MGRDDRDYEQFSALDELAKMCFDAATERGFHDVHVLEGIERESSAGERIALIHSEASEMLEALRDTGDPTKWWYEYKPGQEWAGGKPQGVPTELADVIIRCLDFAGHYGIPIGEIAAAKMRYNDTREFRHGKTM